MSAAAFPPDALDAKAVASWAQYAKERYDAGEKRLSDFRSWARQLAAAVAVVVGLEAALMGQVLKLEGDSTLGMGTCLALLLGTAAYQLVILGRAVAAGYVGKELLLAESPAVLAGHLGGRDEAWTRQTIGAYYAKSSDAVHAAAEGVAKEVSRLAQRFRNSLWLLFAAMVLTGSLTAVSSYARKEMADTPASSGPGPSDPGAAAPPPAQSPSVTPASPLLVTPTPGQTETHGAEPVGSALATPTPGQRLTEGVERRNK